MISSKNKENRSIRQPEAPFRDDSQFFLIPDQDNWPVKTPYRHQ